MLENLKQQRDVISLEAIGGAETLHQAWLKFPGFYDGVKTFMKDKVGDPLKRLFSSKDLSWLETQMRSAKYTDLTDVTIVVPPGFKGSLLEYSSALLEAGRIASVFNQNTLAEFERWISMKLGNPASLAALTQSLPTTIGKNLQDMHKVMGKLDGFFISANAKQSASLRYGDAFHRNQDWNPLLLNMAQLNTMFNSAEHAKIRASVAGILTLVDSLVHRIETEKEVYNISSTSLKNLSEALWQVASQIEMYGVMHFKVTEFFTAMEATRVKLTPIVTGKMAA